MRVAVLDNSGHLVAVKTTTKPKPTDVDAGDLPVGGKFKWNGKTFIPVGFGFGKPKRPTVDRDRATYLLIRALLDGKPIPQECRDWCRWYETHNERKQG